MLKSSSLRAAVERPKKQRLDANVEPPNYTLPSSPTPPPLTGSRMPRTTVSASRQVMRLLALIIGGLCIANLLSAAVVSTGLPLSKEIVLVIHALLMVGVLFIALYFFALDPLCVRGRELERRRDELFKNNRTLEDQLARRNSELAVLQGTLEVEQALRAKAEAETHRLIEEADQQVQARTARLDSVNRELQGQLAEQRGTSELLREREKSWRRLLETAQEGICTWDPQNKLTFLNRHGSDLLGVAAPELLGHAPSEVIVAEDLPAELRTFDLKRAAAPKPLEFRLRRKDGRQIWVRAALAPVKGEKEDYLGALMLFSDISAQRRSEQRLKEQAALWDLAQDALVLCDAGGHIITWNRGAVRLYGWRADEVLGRELFELLADKTNPSPIAEIFTGIKEVGAWRGDLRQVTKDGRRLTIDARVNRGEASGEQPASILMVATDITQKRQREAQILHDHRIESASSLISGLAQELNDTLATVLLSVQILRTKRLERDDEDLLAAIESSAGRSAELLREALVFARGVEGERVVLAPSALFKEMVDVMREMFPRHIQVLSEVPGGTWKIQGDPTQLHQVLLKLCVNARDAMPAGGILRLKAKNVTLDNAAASARPGLKPGPYVVLQVQDTGTGIPAGLRDRVFEPFFTAKQSGKGAGMGLALVYGLIKSHRGTVDFQSEPGVGTTFEILLPAAPETTVEASGATAERREGHGELILWVDDEVVFREVARKALNRHGYEVVVANDGSQALSLLSQHRGRVRVLLTSMMTPSIDGPALAREARQIQPQLRIIASSSLGQSLGQAERLAALRTLGISRILAKPFTTEELLEAIQDELRQQG